VSTVTETVDTYLESRNEPDATRRAALIKQVWAADGRLIDPPLAAEGHAGIEKMMVAQHASYAGYRFRRVSGVDEHHGQIRFAWEMLAPDGSVAVAGLDVGELAEDGRLRRITGFFGELPADAAA
jgi:hypothetical protein